MENGLINIIEIDPYYSITEDKDKKCQSIINSFDINQTQVCIDLETKKLYYTQEFIEFLKTRQLKIVFHSTPLQSFIRILKKKEELNAFVDLERELEKVRILLTYSILNDDNGINRRINKNTKVFKAYKERYKNIIDKHFELKSSIDNSESFEIYPKRLNNFNKITEIPPVYLPNLTPILNKILYGNKSESEFIGNILITEYLKYTIITNPAENIQKHINVNKILEIDRILNNFFYDVNFSKNIIATLCINYNFSIYNIIEITEEIKKAQKEYLSALYKNVKENVITYLKDIMENNIKENPDIIKRNLLNIIKNQEIEDTQIKQPEDLKDFPFKNYVKEITSSFQLNKTANEFRNCLNSYYNTIKERKSLIFVIETEEEKTIAEIKVNCAKISDSKFETYSLYQHKGKNNRQPESKKNEFILFLLCAYLNEKEYKNIINNIDINNTKNIQIENQDSENNPLVPF